MKTKKWIQEVAEAIEASKKRATKMTYEEQYAQLERNAGKVIQKNENK